MGTGELTLFFTLFIFIIVVNDFINFVNFQLILKGNLPLWRISLFIISGEFPSMYKIRAKIGKIRGEIPLKYSKLYKI